jgi:hypothetical protein
VHVTESRTAQASPALVVALRPVLAPALLSDALLSDKRRRSDERR